MRWINSCAEEGIALTTVQRALGWARQSHLWAVTFGTGCCAVEMAAASGPRFALQRFCTAVADSDVRQADLLIIGGTITYKTADRVRQLYNQMAEPKSVLAMGACSIGGGPYSKYGYSVVQGADLIVPVDVYVAGCPPRPEALLEGLLLLGEKVAGKARYTGAASAAGPVAAPNLKPPAERA